MSVNYGEPPSKRSRGEMGFGERTITLNMANYDRSVQYYSDDDLVEIFELGLKIKESAVLSINRELKHATFLNHGRQPEVCCFPI